ncbi:MAG: hypothetical protein IKF97_01375 [Clostridia bacterium]|nr:hypothetical protein [Clostridia bacterium]
MKISKKILIIIAIIIILIICISLVILLNTKNKEDNTQNENQVTKNTISVEPIDNVNIVYSIGENINNMIEDIYDMNAYESDSPFLPQNLINKLNLKEGLKKFYIKKAYQTNMEDDIVVYVTDGYIVDEHSKNIQKDDISLIVIRDKEYDVCRLYDYGESYKDEIIFDNDISKTKILETANFKINKTDSQNKSVDEFIMEEKVFQNRTINEDISENDLVYWYFSDYKIKKAIENKEKKDEISFSYEGDYQNGYTVTDQNGKKYYIKPSKVPMDYEITEK